MGTLGMKNFAWLSLLSLVILAGCKSTPPVNGHVVPEAHLTSRQFVQSDPNRMATLELRDNLAALYLLMDKLYKRNPQQWAKSGAINREAAEAQVRDAIDHRKPLPGLGSLRDVKAMQRAFDSDFDGDRVAALIYGTADMLVTSHGGKQNLYLLDGLDSQRVYNAARNVEIAMWRLSQSKDAHGQPLLVSNELSEHGRNLSFERLFGGIISRTDLVAEFTAEKYRRSAINYLQSFVGGQFLQFIPIQAVMPAS
jgi:hypothetical protein